MAELEKIVIDLHPEDGWPPVSVESLWVEKSGDLWRIDNAPFFANSIALNDLVQARRDPKDGVLEFERVVVPSGHSLITILVVDTEELAKIIDKTIEMGYSIELASKYDLVSVDIAPEQNLDPLLKYLKSLKKSEIADYCENCLGHVS
jgi:Domain of unknown function (DUF4265)